MERVGGITSQRMVCMKDKRFILGVTGIRSDYDLLSSLFKLFCRETSSSVQGYISPKKPVRWIKPSMFGMMPVKKEKSLS